MATVYLHIGTPKTATSSIQIFLGDNAELLNEHGIAFPILDYRWDFVRKQRNAHFLVQGWEPEEEEEAEERTEPAGSYYEALDQIVEVAQDYDRIILSDEVIWYSGTHYERFWPQLKEDLASRGLDLKIIVYLRRQDLFMQSRWKQHVKEKTKMTFKRFLERADEIPYPLDYYAYLQKIADLFGTDSVIVRVFERGQFAGDEHSVYSDFIDIFGLKMSDGFEIKEEVNNTALEGNALEIKRIMNGLPDIREHSRTLRRALGDLPYKERTTMFESIAAQQAYCDRFADSNASVAREFLGRDDGVLFRDPIEDLPPQVFTDEAIFKDTIRTYARTTQLLEEQVDNLKKENKELEKQNSEVFKLVGGSGEKLQSLETEVRRLNHSRFIRFERFCGRLKRRILRQGDD